MEVLDNLQRKNNIKIRGLKETTERGDLAGYLVRLFIDWISLDQGNAVNLFTACRIGAVKSVQRYPHDIIVNFSSWEANIKVLIACQIILNPVIERARISIFPDLCPLSLKKRKSFRFVMDTLQQQGIPYR